MATGFFTDTSVCIGCKACEVACKQWNQLPADGYALTGESYDNTSSLGATTWRHVTFIEQMATKPQIPLLNLKVDLPQASLLVEGLPLTANLPGQDGLPRWLMMSNVCKHCTNAGCLEACPTGAIIRNEFDDVYIQPDICNGCGYCVPACPFGVVELAKDDGRAFKCTLCYDRQKDGLEPACAKACPTDSIIFGDIAELKVVAEKRVEELQNRGYTNAYLYGADENSEVGRLNAFFLLLDKPQVYGLPENPPLPQNKAKNGWLASLAASAVAGAVVAIAFGKGRSK